MRRTLAVSALSLRMISDSWVAQLSSAWVTAFNSCITPDNTGSCTWLSCLTQCAVVSSLPIKLLSRYCPQYSRISSIGWDFLLTFRDADNAVCENPTAMPHPLPRALTLLVSGIVLLSTTTCDQTSPSDAPQTPTPQAAPVDNPPAVASTPYSATLTAKNLSQRCDRELQAATEQFRELENLAAPYTVDSVLIPLDRLYLAIDNATGFTYLMNHVHPDEALQEAADQCVQAFSELLTDVGLSTALYKRVKQVDTAGADSVTQRFQHRVLRDFKRAGVDQDPATRERLRKINRRIVELGQQFSRHIRSDVGTIELEDPASLDGLPDDYVARHSPDDDGTITISTDYPDLFPFMRYSRDDAARKALYQRYLRRAYPENRKTLRALIEKRHELATTLGYPSYAAYATQVLMSDDPETVATFIDRIHRMAGPRAEADYARLLQALREDYPDVTEVGSWQKAYAEERVRKQDYNVDAKRVRQYFQYAKVKRGIFQLVEDLFGIDIRPWETDTWAPEVEAYQVHENGEVIGRFYLDMHPRKLKYKHAAQFGIGAGVDGVQLPMAALVCNFPGGDDPNALMGHRQVETFLHEFGHLLHHIFAGQQRWGLFSGVATERDFVEAPSRMLEEWIWDYDTLKAFAVNHKGQVIPESLVTRMREAREFGRGVHIRNQMFYAALSLSYYSTPPEQLDLQQTMIELQADLSPYPYMPDTHFYASFGHLYGYSAAYYTYMWSEVIAADILRQFEAKGMRNTALAQKYRRTVLAPGGSKDADQLVEDFLGRPFNYEAFIDDLNIGSGGRDTDAGI